MFSLKDLESLPTKWSYFILPHVVHLPLYFFCLILGAHAPHLLNTCDPFVQPNLLEVYALYLSLFTELK